MGIEKPQLSNSQVPTMDEEFEEILVDILDIAGLNNDPAEIRASLVQELRDIGL